MGAKGDLGGNKKGKIEEQRDKQGQSHINSLLVSMLVWLCPAPDQHSLSYLIKFISNSFLVEGFLFCACVCMGV